ncbi:DUF3108 domain-containing protein [Lysobacter sp. A6]|uniref:DUF3108 domain-containing protein n=1 Tax=Noviluteimonas lactosilytica TaxID=2888523 RepID=A0ABS8JK29_9GAMM|nr:DUF3108 domain-containing protein [Lysobacter lactosilyticus]MCC8363957.1 DUF3108 domain-containing protein [Lysobacter lactosilyticus]
MPGPTDQVKTAPAPLLLAALLAAACAWPAAAQQTVPVPATSAAAPATTAPLPEAAVPALVPFNARYRVTRDGKTLGDATLNLVSLPDQRWRIDLRIEATRGLMGLAGLDLQQSTVFDTHEEVLRPLSQSTVRKALFTRKQVTGTYDWSTGVARWTGDLKKNRREPVPLRKGDMNGLLINLAVLRDAAPGATLQYRFVEYGRAKDQQFLVSPAREPQVVDDLAYQALRVERVRGGNNGTTFWVVEAVPTPIRIVQHDDEDTYELQLIDYQEA